MALLQCNYLHLVTPFCFAMNFKNKDVLYKVQNMTIKYLIFSCSDVAKLLSQIKINPLL
jgi:hypothetical protein